jgi:metal-dependent HD superfamily phosphatase/phosphodiesterase
MVRIELSDADAEVVREMLAHKLHDIAIEINRTDSLEFKKMLRQTEQALDRLVRQLPEKSASRE